MKTTPRTALAGACAAALLLPAIAAHAAPDATPHGPATSGSALSVLDALHPAPAPGAHTYVVAPDGSDDGPGTMAAPFRTLMRAQEAASAGDVVYLRGGVYDSFEVPETDNPFEDVYHYVNDISKSGITYAAYPGDPRPVFDFSSVPTDQRVAAFYIDTEVTDVNFVGFDVTGVKVGDQKQSEAFRIAGGANFVDMKAYGNEATGFYYTIDGTGVVLNSDSYDNVAPTARAAGNSDGFGGHANDVWFINDRAWNNSDDGFDSISSSGRVAHINDWSFGHHGNQDGVGDKNGFKVGGYAYRTTGLPDPIPVHTVVNSLSVDNGGNNFYANHQPGQAASWINNTASDPGYGANFNMLERVSPTSPENVAGFREVLHGNLAYSGPLTSNDDTPAEDETGNSWTVDGGLPLADDDFVSLDTEQLTAPRRADGGLPDVDLLKPVAGSAAEANGLGYLADDGDVRATLTKLVDTFVRSGDVDAQGRARLLGALRGEDLSGFTSALETQQGPHVSQYARTTLLLAAVGLQY
ncbi:right-handed parallel beta-helix repeat-containing protein [Isoptericola sp. BMS4]|uniref:right-handed parallel beta-helix repeat-containing protein n=1 Tax=Isoptericola sp. BMS4 TaxID=2527875 RepID=UPI00196B98C5|nr:DUF4990 domain-containing protein [Isoptericola sp. BMS4]